MNGRFEVDYHGPQFGTSHQGVYLGVNPPTSYQNDTEETRAAHERMFNAWREAIAITTAYDPQSLAQAHAIAAAQVNAAQTPQNPDGVLRIQH